MNDSTVQWLLDADEPWTRYRMLIDLLDCSEEEPEVQAARAALVADPQVCALIADLQVWPGPPLKRHNDAKHPVNRLPVLADFGLCVDDPGVASVVDQMLAQQHPDGPLRVVMEIYERYGGTGKPMLSWALCDATMNLYSLGALGMSDHSAVQRAAQHMVGFVTEPGEDRWPPGGWPCVTGAEFRGPGRKSDPCPISNLHALRALDALGWHDHPAAALAAEMLLTQWERQEESKLYLFGIGTDFRKLKYPFVWYHILYFADTLSRFPALRDDPRLHEVVDVLKMQADDERRYTAASMYRIWKGWSFADKKTPSPWLTFLALRIQRRMQNAG